jgi:hypothetical protein
LGFAPQLKRDPLGSVMIYGDLSLRDRLLRALIGAIIGGGAGLLFMLRQDMLGRFFIDQRSTFLLPATCIGAVIGGLLAFRRKRI